MAVAYLGYQCLDASEHWHSIGTYEYLGVLVGLARCILQFCKDVVDLYVGDGFARPLLLSIAGLETILAAPQFINKNAIVFDNLLMPVCSDDGRIVDLFPPGGLGANLARELPHWKFNESDWFVLPRNQERESLWTLLEASIV